MKILRVDSPRKNSVFKYPKFLVLWLSEAISMVGDRLLMVVLIALVYDYTHSPASIGIMMTLKAIPALVLGNLAGIFADRLPRKWIMVISNLAQGILVLLIPLTNNVIIIYLIYFLMSAVSQFFMPARSATIPDLVSSEVLMDANSLFALSIVGSMAVGPALGGWINDYFGSKAAFYTDSFTFLIPALAVSLMFIPQVRELSKKIKIGSDIKEGYAYVSSNKPILYSLILLITAFITVGTISVLGIIVVREHMKASSSGFGMIMSLLGVGMVIGALLTIRIKEKINNQILGSLGACISGIAMIIFPLLPNLPLGLISSFFNGIGLIIIQVICQTTLLKSSEKVRGRIQGISQMIIGSTTFIASSLAGLLAERVGAGKVVIGAGIIALLIGGVIILLQQKSIRGRGRHAIY